jgi:DDE family transposase
VGGVRGYDGAKKLSRRKRHLLADTLGMAHKASVHSPNLQDRATVALVLEDAAKEFPRLEQLWVDHGYTGARVKNGSRSSSDDGSRSSSDGAPRWSNTRPKHAENGNR